VISNRFLSLGKQRDGVAPRSLPSPGTASSGKYNNSDKIQRKQLSTECLSLQTKTSTDLRASSATIRISICDRCSMAYLLFSRQRPRAATGRKTTQRNRQPSTAPMDDHVNASSPEKKSGKPPRYRVADSAARDDGAITRNKIGFRRLLASLSLQSPLSDAALVAVGGVARRSECLSRFPTRRSGRGDESRFRCLEAEWRTNCNAPRSIDTRGRFMKMMVRIVPFDRRSDVTKIDCSLPFKCLVIV
jgi:hypothetical protein